MKSLILICVALILPATAAAADKRKVTYFSCPVIEDGVKVSVKFAIENYDPNEGKGELLEYPGVGEDSGYISVTPTETGKHFSLMNNLNAQGGDLTIKGNGDIFLFGDGDGYQFTDLVLWWDKDDLEEVKTMEGYVRDYGHSYSEGEETFKQFIKCEVSAKAF